MLASGDEEGIPKLQIGTRQMFRNGLRETTIGWCWKRPERGSGQLRRLRTGSRIASCEGWARSGPPPVFYPQTFTLPQLSVCVLQKRHWSLLDFHEAWEEALAKLQNQNPNTTTPNPKSNTQSPKIPTARSPNFQNDGRNRRTLGFR